MGIQSGEFGNSRVYLQGMETNPLCDSILQATTGLPRDRLTIMFQSFRDQIQNRIACVYQSQESECALACLAMLTNFYGINCTLNDLNTIYSSTRGGLDVGQLVALAQTTGVRLIPHKISNDNDLKTLQCPAIALVDGTHYVVIARIENDFVDILDPLLGRIQLNLNQMNHGKKLELSKFLQLLITGIVL